MKTSLRRSEIFLPASSIEAVFFWNFFCSIIFPCPVIQQVWAGQLPDRLLLVWPRISGRSRVGGTQSYKQPGIFPFGFPLQNNSREPFLNWGQLPLEVSFCLILSWRTIWSSSSSLPSLEGSSGHFPHPAMFLGYRAPLAFPTHFLQTEWQLCRSQKRGCLGKQCCILPECWH